MILSVIESFQFYFLSMTALSFTDVFYLELSCFIFCVCVHGTFYFQLN